MTVPEQRNPRHQRDPRRDRPINVHRERGDLYRLTIDGELWSSVEHHPGRNRWCIEDSRNRCLLHVDGILGDEEKASQAIATGPSEPGRRVG
jgi:hypothetical protein